MADGNGMNRAVTVVDPSQAFERSLAVHQDTCHLMGKFFITFNLTANTLATPLTFLPANFGNRAASLGAIFSRYRFKYVHFKYSAITGSGSGSVAIGILDDFSGEGDAPTSISGILELRCSSSQLGINTQSSTNSQQFLWEPVDKKRWMYNFVGSGDARFTQPAITYVQSTVTGTFAMQVDFSIVFAGAVDTAGL